MTSDIYRAEHDYVQRSIDLAAMLREKSYFLLGPRQTGKSSLIRNTLKNAKVYNLLDNSLFLELSRRPGLISEEILPNDKLVVIDEVQRLPAILNEVHRLIEEKGVRFLLMGSSARKLRRGGVNLLGGRARTCFLHPFTSGELGADFKLERALNSGLLPPVYFSGNPQADLESYAGSYLQQEVIAEAATRNIPAFSRFLKVAALCNASLVNFTKVANDSQIPRTTVYEYFDILKDTLILRELPAFRAGRKRKPVCTSKYYFFDVGVLRCLQGRTSYAKGTPEFGEAFETFMINEVFAAVDYAHPVDLGFWRTSSGFEVDLVIAGQTAVEFKAKEVIDSEDLRSLRAIEEESSFKHLICVGLGDRNRRVGNIDIIPFNRFLQELPRFFG